MIRISISLDEATHYRLVQAASTESRNISQMVGVMIRTYLRKED